MKKDAFLTRFLIVAIMFLAGNLFLGMYAPINAKPTAVYAPLKKAVPIECWLNGSVVAYGATCTTGDKTCNPNGCPF